VPRHSLIGIILLSIGALSACNSSPTSPSSSSQSSVTVNGSVFAPGGGNASTQTVPAGRMETIPAGMTVSITGTNVTAQVNAAGRFALLNVPPGNAELRFNAPGILASISLIELQAGQTIELTVTVSDTSATVESDRRSLGREEQVEGRVESLPPTTAALSLVVAGRTVTTDGNTTFYLAGAPVSFSSLEIGQRVHVKGQTNAGTLLARTIDIQNTNTTIGVNLNGTVSAFTGTAAAFQFQVDGRLVKGDALTEFYGNSRFLDLVNGGKAEVKGSQRDGFVYAQRIHAH
jgi:hypothetical protein